MNFLASLMEFTTSTFVRSLFETEQSDQTVLSGSIYFLGKSYLLPIQKTQYEKDVITRFWFTYRQGFAPIGSSGLSSDQGWGCMLRCGQMMMAHALVCRHLGRDWIWDYKLNPASIPSTQALHHLQTYHSILRSFSDQRDSCYSVHQLTSIGAADGKEVGEWYGPNTIAHVLKKASSKDSWSNVIVHVCMDNTVIVNDIIDLCKRKKEIAKKDDITHLSSSKTTNRGNSNDTNNNQDNNINNQNTISNHNNSSNYENKSCNQDNSNKDPNNIHNNNSNHVNTSNHDSNSNQVNTSNHDSNSNHVNTSNHDSTSKQDNTSNHDSNSNHDNKSLWTPLLLIIPLRLGVTEMNKAYYKPLKTFFELKQTTGVLGGRPNNAYWFVGCSDDFLLYLDPHTVQPINDESVNFHSSYHVTSPSRVHVSHLDPSIAATFFCNSEEDFTDLIMNFHSRILNNSKTPVFEVHASRPTHLYCQPSISTTPVNSGSRGEMKEEDEMDKSCSGQNKRGLSKNNGDTLANDSDFELVNYDEEFEIID